MLMSLRGRRNSRCSSKARKLNLKLSEFQGLYFFVPGSACVSRQAFPEFIADVSIALCCVMLCSYYITC